MPYRTRVCRPAPQLCYCYLSNYSRLFEDLLPNQLIDGGKIFNLFAVTQNDDRVCV